MRRSGRRMERRERGEWNVERVGRRSSSLMVGQLCVVVSGWRFAGDRLVV